MATLGQQAQARGFVASPFAPAPVRPAASAAPKRTAKDPAPTSLLSQRLAASRGRNQQQQEQEQAAGGILGRGLGMVLNNPVANVVLRPLDVLDVPRRAVWSTIQEVKDAATGEGFSPWDWYNQTNPLHAITQRGDVSFGAGDVLPEINTPLSAGWDQWINRGVGLAGDIAGDPLTYVAGLGFVADAAKVATSLDKLADAQRVAKGLAESEDVFRALGFADELVPAARRGADLAGSALPATRTPQSEAMFRALGFGDTMAPSARYVETAMPSHLPGAGALATELGGTQALERLGRRGLSGATPLQRSIMGLPEQAVNVKVPFTRMQPRPLPGTRGIGAAFAEGKAAVKEGARRLPGMERVRAARAPVAVAGNDLFPAYERILTGKGGGSIEGAISTIAIDNRARRAGGKFGKVAAQELNRLDDRIRALTPEQRSELVRAAEEDPTVINELTDFQQKVIDVAKYTGVDLPEMQGGRYVMPHVLDRGFRNFIMKLHRSNDPRALSFMHEAGLTTEDLLEEGGFMQRRRWRPNEDGTPFKAEIAGQNIEIEIGSVDELNQKLAEAFPDYKGKIYETDPIIAWRGYIQSTSKDVAKRYAYTKAAQQGTPNVAIRPKQPQQYDPYGGRIDLPPRKGPDGEDIPVQQVTKAEPYKMTPEQARFYRPTTTAPSAIEATKARNKAILKTQPKLLEEYRTASQARRYEIAAELEKITDDLLGPISEERARMLRLRNQAGQTRDVAAARIEELQTIELPAIQAQIDEIGEELKRLANARSNVARTSRNRVARNQDELLSRLDARRSELIQQRDDLTAIYKERSGTTRDVAQAELDRVRAAAPEEKRRAIARYESGLLGRRDQAHEKLTTKLNAERRRWKNRREFKNAKKNRFGPADGTSEAGYKAANDYLTQNPDNLRQLRELEDVSYELRRKSAMLSTEIQRINEEIAHARKEINRVVRTKPERERRLAFIEEKMWERQALQNQYDALQPQLQQAHRNLNNVGTMKATREALDYRETYRRFKDEMREQTGPERGRVGDIEMEWERWKAGKAEEARRTAPPAEVAPPPPTNAAEAVKAEVSPIAVAGPQFAEPPTPEDWKNVRDIMEDELVDIVDESNLDQLDALYSLSDKDTETFLNEMWDSIPPNGQQRINNVREHRSAGWMGEKPTGAAPVPEQLALPAGEAPTPKESIPPRNEPEVPTVSPEVAEAQKYLRRKDAMQYIEDRNRVASLSEQRIKTRTGRNKTETKKLQAELRKERRVLVESLEKRAAIGNKVKKYEAVLKEANKPPPPLPPGPPRHPVFEQIESEAARAEQAAQARVFNEKVQQSDVNKEFMPQFEKNKQELTDTTEQLGRIAAGTDEEYNRIALREGMEAIEKRRVLSDEAERAKLARGELTEAQARADEEIGAFQVVYNDAVQNEAKYRAEHARIATKADSTRVNRAKDRAEMMPKGTKLDEAESGVIPSFEAQPLQRTVDDLNKVIALNPTGNDQLVKRAEAALHPMEQKLAQLTTELDIPAHQVEQIIAAARKGELAPVISYVMKSNWRQVWTGGDVVISKELETAYRHLTSALDNPGEFARILTAYTNFFKTYATLTPGFHVRNGLSAIFMNTVDGVAMRNQFDGLKLWREYAKSDSPLLWLQAQTPEVQDAFEAVFASGAGGRYFEAGFAKSTSGGRRQQTLFSNPLTRLSQKVGQDWTEGPVRLGMALDSIRTGQTVTDAMTRITRIHFDYGQISKFDEKAKRLIPFWTFMSRNLPMQITEMWSKPRVYAWFNSVVRNLSGEPPEGGVPDYFGQLQAFPLADTKLMGMPLFLQPDLGHVRVQTDLSDLEKALSGENLMRPLTNLNPIYTALPEYITQRDFYTGQEFGKTDVRKLGPMEKLMQPALNALNLTKTAPDGTPLVEERLPNMLQALNPLYARGARLAPELTTGAEGDMQRQVEAWARTFLGLPIRTLSPEQQKNARKSEYFDKREDYLVKQAMAKAAAA